MNRLFVAYKPPFIGSNAFLNRIKRRYGVKKAGFSGTLDPFACGSIIIAFGAYTKLFRFLKKYPKVYRATIWLGAQSESLDLENIKSIEDTAPLPPSLVKETIEGFKGEFRYIPPAYSAKKVGGKRAYKLAAKGEEVELKEVVSRIEDIKLISYRHPFITFEATVSEGTYIRSLAEHISEKLGLKGTLSYLERVREGMFKYDNERKLDVVEYLNTEQNFTTLSKDDVWHGKKIEKNMLKNQKDGIYHLLFDDFFAIISVEGERVKYLLNQIPRK